MDLTSTTATEAALLAATPDDLAPAEVILATLPDDPPPGDALDPLDPVPDDGPGELMTEAEFQEQFAFLHHIGQSLIEAKTGEDTCPIGNLAESTGGKKAASAAYRIAARNEFIAGMILRKGNGLLSDLFAVGMHCFTVRNLVVTALAKAPANAV